MHTPKHKYIYIHKGKRVYKDKWFIHNVTSHDRKEGTVALNNFSCTTHNVVPIVPCVGV